MKVGVDLLEIEDFEKILKVGGSSFLKTHFSVGELKNTKVEHLAGLFTAKEAIFKTGVVELQNFMKVQILNEESGKPVVYDLNGYKIDGVDISISHTKTTVVAVCIWDQQN